MASYKTEAAEKLLKGVTGKLHSNKAINTAFDFVGQGGANAYRFGKEVMRQGDIMDAAKTVYKQDGAWNYGQIAGSYLAVSGAARLATGGGIYKDGQGNNDIIGIPGI